MILNLPIKVRKDLCILGDDFGVSSRLWPFIWFFFFSNFALYVFLLAYFDFNGIQPRVIPILFHSSRIFLLASFFTPCIFNFVMNVYETSRLRTLLLYCCDLTHGTPLHDEAMIIRSPFRFYVAIYFLPYVSSLVPV